MQSTAQNGIEKLSLLAKLDEPQREEIVQEVDVESVTVKELKKKIDDLEADSKRKDKENTRKRMEMTDELQRVKNKYAEVVDKLGEEQHKADEAERKSLQAYSKLSELESQIQELESRPVEVAVEKDTAEIDRLTEQLEQERQKHQAELEKIKSENLDNTEIEKATFQAFFTNAADALRRLCDFTKNIEHSDNLGYYIRRIVTLVEHAENEINK